MPLEIAINAHPKTITPSELDILFGISTNMLDNFFLTTHPKINMLEAKVGSLEIEKSLKQAALFPDVKLNFNLLQANTENFIPINTEQYKAGIRVQMPLFLRKERGSLTITKLKISDATWDLNYERVKIQNKIEENIQAQENLLDQFMLTKQMVDNYETLLKGEQQKFNEGESSLFVVISREQKLIETLLKRNNTENKFYAAKLGIFKALALPLN